MFTVEMLAAGRGDCLWIEYGDRAQPHVILVDGGIPGTEKALAAKLTALPPNRRHIDLVVITHIDIDHIAGVLGLLRDPVEQMTIGDFWFNAWKHLPVDDPGELGAKQGEEVSFLLEKRGLPWNNAFGGEAAVVTKDDELPVIAAPGRNVDHVALAPAEAALQPAQGVEEGDRERRASCLARRAPSCTGRTRWTTTTAGFSERRWTWRTSPPARSRATRRRPTAAASRCSPNTMGAGASSPAMRLPTRCCKSSRFSRDGDDLFEIDALKLSHHGGRKNTSAELIQALACRTISSPPTGRSTSIRRWNRSRGWCSSGAKPVCRDCTSTTGATRRSSGTSRASTRAR